MSDKRIYDVKDVYQTDFSDGMIKDFDFKSRTVTGYFSRFGNKDHDGDVLLPGSFNKSIEMRGAGSKNLIPHLADHWMDTNNLLAKPKLFEKPDGGFFESTISDTTKGLDILKQYRDGLINQHSFGFKILRSDDKEGYREIKEVLLYEISTVVLGANENTPFSGFKSFTKPQLIDRYNRLQKCFRDGDYSDDFFEVLKFQIKQIEQDMLDIFIKEQTIECPKCNKQTPDVESGMGYITCKHCGNTITQKQQTTNTIAPTSSNVTQPGVDVLNVLTTFNNTFKQTDDGRKENSRAA